MMGDAEVKALLDGATPGPWKMETVRTSCGTCHRIGPFPRPNYASKEEGWACVYDDYPPGIGSPDLLSNARLIAAAPDLARALLDARAENARLRADAQAANGVWQANLRLQAELAAAQQREAGLVEALTPSGDTKAAYMGEIKDPDTKRMVSWTAIKMVMAMVSARAALSHGGRGE